jgi:hypothetical protein
LVAGSSRENVNGNRNPLLAFHDGSMVLPAGLEFFDDLDAAT